MDWSQDNGLAQQRALTRLYERRLLKERRVMTLTRKWENQAGVYDPASFDQWESNMEYDDTSARALLGADIKPDAES